MLERNRCMTLCLTMSGCNSIYTVADPHGKMTERLNSHLKKMALRKTVINKEIKRGMSTESKWPGGESISK